MGFCHINVLWNTQLFFFFLLFKYVFLKNVPEMYMRWLYHLCHFWILFKLGLAYIAEPSIRLKTWKWWSWAKPKAQKLERFELSRAGQAQEDWLKTWSSPSGSTISAMNAMAGIISKRFAEKLYTGFICFKEYFWYSDASNPKLNVAIKSVYISMRKLLYHGPLILYFSVIQPHRTNQAERTSLMRFSDSKFVMGFLST